MLYDSLLLDCGGGIVNDAFKVRQSPDAATLAIGIGGTGIAALSQLKRKIHEHLIPDNPDEATSTYQGIQLLAIDHDCSEYKKYRGSGRIHDHEFFSVFDPHILKKLWNKEEIKNNDCLNWMDIDRICRLKIPEVPYHIRQVNRFMVISKAAELSCRIEEKCANAMRFRRTGCIDIHIFSGLAGGMGSGCFLDICYIAREICVRNGWNVKIYGYFFLPDVMFSKPEIADNAAAKTCFNARAYAALKELDYHMDLQDAHDWFSQKYCTSLYVHTQTPPCDMCYLISGSQADGNVFPDGFSQALNAATDYVLAYQIDIGEDEKWQMGLTIRGHLANCSHGVRFIPNWNGANRCYSIIGGAYAELPTTEINTYLAAGFMSRFDDILKDKHTVIRKKVIDTLIKELRITDEEIFKRICKDVPSLELLDLDKKVLKMMGVMQPRMLPGAWAACGNNWMDRVAGTMAQNLSELTKELKDYSLRASREDSLIAKLFHKLRDYALDPQYGPYYAASLLDNADYDLVTALDAAIGNMEEFREAQILQSKAIAVDLTERSKEFVLRSNKNTYANYKDAATRWYVIHNRISQCENTVKALRIFKEQVKALYSGFFKPLCGLLDNLKDTFQENQKYIDKLSGTQPSHYGWQILTVEDLSPRLDNCIANLTKQQIIDQFVSCLIDNSEAWIHNDQDQIAKLVRDHMLNLFKEQTNRNLQDYLFDKYPRAQGDPTILADEVKDDIIDKVHKSAVPMFWCDPSFTMNCTNIFEYSSISVPNLASAVYTAADNFRKAHNEYDVIKTCLSNRISVNRACSGVPLYAYGNIVELKRCYDMIAHSEIGIGLHLYSDTGRGDDGSGHKDWCQYLPTPLPYSMFEVENPDLIPEGAALKQLYKDGEACGAIRMTRYQEYAVFASPDLKIKNYSADDFLERECFIQSKFDNEKTRLEEMKAHMHNEDQCQTILLKDDGYVDFGNAIVERTRIDHFIHHPVMHGLVRDELAKVKSINAALATLDEIHSVQKAYNKDLESFCNLLFYKCITCTDLIDKVDYESIAYIYFTYQDQYDDTKKHFLSIRGNAKMPYAGRFPLYQAFLTYRGMDPEKSPRAELDRTLEEHLPRLKKREDAFVAAWLYRIWDERNIALLYEDCYVYMSPEETAKIVGFYEGLRGRISRLRDEFPVWLSPNEVDQLRGLENITALRWIYDNGENLVLYPDQSLNFAWSQIKNEWVPLHSGMLVLAGNSQWLPVQLDRDGSIIL